MTAPEDVFCLYNGRKTPSPPSIFGQPRTALPTWCCSSASSCCSSTSSCCSSCTEAVLGSLGNSSHLHTWSWSPHLEGGLTAALPPGCPPRNCVPPAAFGVTLWAPCFSRALSPSETRRSSHLKVDRLPWAGVLLVLLAACSQHLDKRPAPSQRPTSTRCVSVTVTPTSSPLSVFSRGGGGLRGRTPSQHRRHQPRPTACKDGPLSAAGLHLDNRGVLLATLYDP